MRKRPMYGLGFCGARHTAAVALVVLLLPRAHADVKLPALLGDGLVLQQESNVTIWGWAAAGEKIEVLPSWTEEATETEGDATGKWRVSVVTPEAGGPHTITVRGHTRIVLKNVMIGEVWLCSGQSNMEMTIGHTSRIYRGVKDAAAVIAAADEPQLRFFDVANTVSAHPRIDVSGRWVECRPDSAPSLSATAYFFGREISRSLGGVPVGLICADWGGTAAEAWMSEDALGAFPDLADDLRWLRSVGNPNTRGDSIRARQRAWWKARGEEAATALSRAGAQMDPSGWPVMTLPATLQGNGLDTFDGIVFFQREVELDAPAAERDAVLELGPIDDYDDVWINETHVGSIHEPDSWARARRSEIPASALRPGRNSILVRVLDTGGPGGINGRPEQLKLKARDGSFSVPLKGEWRFALGPAVSALPRLPENAGVHQNVPTVLFNGMIAPLRPYRIRGVIWYQGESNRRRALEYRTIFPALIRDWRRQWQTELPFYYVQIAPFRYRGDYGQTAAVREAQLRTLELPGTGMAVTMDIGNPADIHPRQKEEVGRRLSLWARVRTYGETDLVHSGPLYRSLETEGNSIRLHFDHVGSGLVLRESPRSHFLIAASDGRFVPARARIEGDSIVVDNPRVAQPAAVRYAWEAAAEPNLFNREGLPASPFRTDDFSPDSRKVDNGEEIKAHRSRDPGFRNLFNGGDLAGWKNVNGAPSTWQVRDGMIICTGVPTGVLRTESMFQDFVLELEWRHLVPGGNAGLFVWSDALPARGQPFTRSIEVQIMDGSEGAGFTSDGDIFPIHGARMEPVNGRGGTRAFPTERRVHPSPQWNHYRVVAEDGNLSLAVNGKIVTQGKRCDPAVGYICLESEGSEVHFRNIRLQAKGPVLAVQPDRWRSLYNGVDLTGWRHGPEHEGHWVAADWRLAFDGQGDDLWTEESFRDFQLICDWRWTGPPEETERPVILSSGEYAPDEEGNPRQEVVADAGDSGIYVRGSSKSQVNIWCWPVGSGEVYGYRTDPEMAPEVKAAVTPRVRADAPVGEWNRFIITLVGDRLTVNLNDHNVIENARLPGIAESGPIGLQKHGSPIEFANLYVRELGED